MGSRGDEQYTGWGVALVKKRYGGSRGDESKQRVVREGAVGDPGKMGEEGRWECKKGITGKGAWGTQRDGSGHGG